ncbi:MAG: FAD-binding oxidoreductase [Oligoflexales bacterium]
MSHEKFLKDLDKLDIVIQLDEQERCAVATDWTGMTKGTPLAVAYPVSTAQVSDLLKVCSAHGISVVPSGGRTGLAGGAVSLGEDLVLSLEKMDTIYRVDPIDMTIEVGAGVKTQRAQESAQECGLMFPLDLAAKGSCHIGGNLATNAGGLKFIAHGGAKEQVLGLEVVLADGRVLEMGHGLRKNNTGYDLQNLFIGSEGTLGIITKATLRLVLPPGDPQLVCLGVHRFEDILKLLQLCHAEKLHLSAFEFFTQEAHEITLEFQSHRLKTPFATRSPFYVLLEAEDSEKLQTVMEKGFEEEWLIDGVMASSETEYQQLWALRESITESVACAGRVHKNDVSVVLSQLPALISRVESLSQAQNYVRMVLFGHIGDGNIHINYVGSKELDFDIFKEHVRELELEVFKELKNLQGSISAEHGIGLLKREDLFFSRTDIEMEWMKKIKLMFDPQNLLNPGKIFE